MDAIQIDDGVMQTPEVEVQLPEVEAVKVEAPEVEGVEWDVPEAGREQLPSELDFLNETNVEEKQEARKPKDEDVLSLVFLMDADKGLGDEVRKHPQYCVYDNPMMRKSYSSIGRDLAEAWERDGKIREGFSHLPQDVAQGVIDGMEDVQKREKWQKEYNNLKMEVGDAPKMYYALLARMQEEGVRDWYDNVHLPEKQRNEELRAEQEEALMNPGAEMSLGLMQNLKNLGTLERVEKVRESLKAVGYGDAEAVSPVPEYEDLAKVLRLIGDDEEAMGVFLNVIAQRSQKEAAEGKTGMWRQMAESVSEGVVQGVQDSLEHGGLRYQMAGNELNELLEQEGSENLVSYLENGGMEEWMQMDEKKRQALEQELRNAPRVQAQEVAKVAALRQKIREAKETGRAQADAAGQTGMAASTRRTVGAGMGAILPWLGSGVAGGAMKGLAVLGIAGGALGEKSAEAENKGIDDMTQAYKASMASATGETVGMMVGAPLIKAGVGRLLPGLGKVNSAIGMKVIEGGFSGTLANFGAGTLRTAIDFGVVIPTATAIAAGITNYTAEVDPELGHAWEDWLAHFKEYKKADKWGAELVQSAMLAALHIPDVKRATRAQMDAIKDWGRSYEMRGGKPEVFEEAKRKHGELNARAVVKECEADWEKEMREHPVETIARGKAALKAEINKAQAANALADNATKQALARFAKVEAETLENGKVRVWLGVKVNADGKIERGERYEDVDPDVAERYLGTLGNGIFEKIANATRDFFAGRLSIEEFKKLYGEAAREEVLPQAQSLDDMRAMAERARLRKQEIAAGDESKLEAAGKVIDPKLSSELTLDALIELPKYFENRGNTEAERGGSEKPITNAYVVPVTMGDGTTRYVLRHTKKANFFALSEELGEQAMLNYIKVLYAGGKREEVAFPMETLARDLLDMRAWMRESEKYKKAADKWFGISEQLEGKLRNKEVLTVAEGRQLEDSVVEAMSTLFRSGMVGDAMTPEGNLPGWMRPVISACAEASTHAPEYATIGGALRELEEAARTSPEGVQRYQETVNKLMQHHRDVLERMFKEYRDDPTAEQIAKMEEEVQRAQNEQNARVGRGVSIAPEETERGLADFNAEQQANAQADAVDEAEAQAGENAAREDIKSKPGNDGMSEEEVTRERTRSFAEAQEERIANDPAAQEDAAGIFMGGKYTPVQAEGFGDVQQGMVPVALISLGTEGTPRGANYEGMRIGSDAHYRPNHEPIYLWQRANGELLVIDGHNRLLRAKLAGADSINAYVFTETEERTEQWARAKYYEKNVREHKASVKEVAWFVSGANIHGRQLTAEELAEYGLNEEQSNKVRIGIMLGRYGAPEVLDALFDRPGEYEFEEDVLARGGISLADAVRIVEYAKGDRDVQLEGLRALRGEADENGVYGQGRNIEAARRVMQLFLVNKANPLHGEIGEVEAERTRHFLRWLADYQGRKLKEVEEDIALLEAQGLTKELMEKYGIDRQQGGNEEVLTQLRNEAGMWRMLSVGDWESDRLKEVREAYAQEFGGEEEVKQRYVEDALATMQSYKRRLKTPDIINSLPEEKIKEYHGATKKMKYAGARAEVHEWLNEMRAKYARKAAAWRKAYKAMHEEKDREKQREAQKKIIELGAPLLEEARARGYIWEYGDPHVSKQIGDARVGAYIAGAIMGDRKLHFESQLWEFANYKGKKPGLKKKYDDAFFAKWTTDGIDESMKMLKNPDFYEREKIDEEYKKSKRAFFENYAEEKIKELQAEEERLRNEGIEEGGISDAEEVIRRQQEMWQHPAEHDELLDEAQRAYGEETGEQMWLNEGINEAGERVRNVHFSTEEKPLASEGFSPERYREKSMASVRSVYGTSAPEAAVVDKLWREVVDAVIDGRVPRDSTYHLPVCPTPAVLRLLGVPDLMVGIRASVLLNKATAPEKPSEAHHEHYVTREQFYEIPGQMGDPVAVYEPKKKLKGGRRSFVLLTSLEEERPNGERGAIVVPVHISVDTYSGIEINRLPSIYGKGDARKIQGWNLVYANKQKLADIPSGSSLQLLRLPELQRAAENNVLNEAHLVNYKRSTYTHFSVEDAKKRGMFKDERLEVENGVIAEHGAHFSVDFSHVSPALYRRVDKEHVGSGEGNAAFGWGYIYGAESPEVNREYHGSFTKEVFVQGHGENAKEIPQEKLVDALKKLGVTNPRLAFAWTSKEDLIEDRKTTKSVVQELEKMLEREERKEKENTRRTLEREKQRLLVQDYLIENDIVLNSRRKYPVNYRMRADVDDSNVLLWDESFDYFWVTHEEVQDALKALLPSDVFASLWGGEDGYGIWHATTGEGFYKILTEQLGSPRAASEWLDAHGIRGVKYLDGLSRGRWERREEDKPYTYNYVIFNPDYIEIIAINNRHEWSEYSEGNADWQKPEDVFNEDGTPRVHFSLGGERAATYGEMEAAGLAYYDPADGKRKFALPTAGVRLKENFTPGELNVPDKGHKDVSLAALLHYPELFRAYPELGNMRVRLYKEKGTGVRGFYAPNGTKPKEGAYIALNMAHGTEPERVLNTLLHESQHAIQHHEGWARGAGDMDRKGALKYVRKAMAERKKQGLGSDWAKENMSFLTSLHTVLMKGKGQDLQTAITAAYWLSHGEQEARYAGERLTETEGGVPRVTGVAASTDTIAVLPDKITELGGITFGNAGIYARLMESRLAPVGDFHTDRRLYQIRESAVRYARLLNGFTREKDKTGESLLLEAQGVAERAVSLLPNEYRVGLEPYRVWLSVFAEMSKGGFAAAERASAMVPMRGWGERIYRSIGKQIYSVFSGRVPEREMEFWLEREESRKLFEQAREMYNEAKEKAEATGARGQSLYELTEVYLRNDARYHGVVEQLIGELGKVKTEKVLAKLLERVKHQLDAYRKDKTLGAMRKAVAAAYPVPGKGGKPVKGKMNADSYRALEDYMALLELTEGEQAMFERERYTGEGKEKAWADLEEGDLITVDVWNDDGEKRVITCTKMEYETYACYERMTPEQAEAAARALGEFITTGKQAWENKQEAQKRQVTEWCRDILDEFDTSENARRAEAVRNEGVLPGRRWFLNLTSWTMNPAQIFDVLAHVPGLQTFARHVGSRIERAEVQLQQWDKERLYRTAEIMRDVCGVKSKKELRQFIDDMNLTRESGIELIERAPDFLRQESEVLRRQFLGLLHRKMRQKNFNANTFAAAFEELVKDELMPEHIAEEAQAKYGAVGDAKKSRLHGADAVFSLLTEDELNKFYDLRKETVKRAKKAEEKWLKEKEEKKAKLEESGGKMRQSHGGEMLQLTKGEAAYRVLLAEQPAYTEMLRQQGYTEEVVQQMREFAGEKVMNLAYALRDELAKRTPEMKALYEKVYGMPFPEEENYFRAFFDVGQETTQRTLGERSEGKASGGGKIYITYTRHQHHSKVDPTMNLLTAYLTVQKQQDVLLAYRDLPQKIQGVLAHQEDGVRMSAALERVVGRGMVTNVRTIAEHMQAAAGEVERVGRDLTNVIDSLGSAAAHAVLNGRVASNAKQFTALFNTLAGSDNVSLWEWEKSKSRVLAGLGVISTREMAARPELASRFKGWEAAGLGEAMFAKADEVTGHGATASESRAGMSFMEKLDVWNNVKSSCILYDAVYRKMKKENPGLTHEELDAAAMDEVRHALAMKSQPQGWRTRSLLATKRSIFSVGNLFLGGESINTFANTARLLAEGRYGRAAAVWFAHGAALQALTFLYNWLTDDEEQWKRRSWKQYAMGVLAGPFMSVPVIGLTIANLGNAVGGGWVPTQNLLPGADLPRLCRTIKSIFSDKKKTTWMDKTIAVNDVLRTVAMGALIGKPKSVGHAKVQGVAMATTLVSNLLDFVLRTTRAASERL